MQSLSRLLKGFKLQWGDGKLNENSNLYRLKVLLAGAAHNARTSVFREARQRQCRPSDLNATLLLMVYTRLEGKDLVGALQIGDGLIGILPPEPEDKCTILGVADHGEHGGETRFLTTPYVELEFESRIVFTIKDAIRCVAIMSDGVSDDFFPENERLLELFVANQIRDFRTSNGDSVPGVWHEVVKNPCDGKALLDWLRYEKKQSFDDRTLVLVYRNDLV